MPIFFNVDATKLHENENFNNKYYSKVIFNFPHVGGKMKIQLNRELLKNFFKSVRHIVTDSSLVIISLCQGQGGTHFDKLKRKWSDSWQVSEMAGHGGFILTNVEPFLKQHFKEYSCIGYRSQDVKFNLDGALVHVFVKRKLPFEHLALNTSTQIINLTASNDLFTSVPSIYSELWAVNILSNSKSAISFIKDLIIKDLNAALMPNLKLNIFTENDISFLACNKMNCTEKNKLTCTNFKLHQSVFDVLKLLLQQDSVSKEEIIFFSGIYFCSNSGRDLFSKPPANFKFLIVGDKLSKIIEKHIKYLINIFKKENLMVFLKASSSTQDPKFSLIESANELICKNLKTMDTFVPAVIYSLYYNERQVEACVINTDEVCKQFFDTSSWKELWSEESVVIIGNNEKPILKQIVLSPLSYKFDITLRYNKEENFSEDKMYKILWFAAGQLIEEVEFVNEYNSNEDWSSKCYRITYKSLDKPLNRDHVINIHSKLIAPMIEIGMNVSVR